MKFINNLKNNLFSMFKNITKRNSKERRIFQIAIIFLLSLGVLSRTYSWLYEEYVGSGVGINFGKISHIITHYDDNGNLIQDEEQTQTLLYETNLSNVSKGSKYIKIENDGTLDLEYTLSLSYEGTVANAGVLYYRLYEITEAVNEFGSLNAYATANPIPDNLETDSTNPVKNMSLINSEVYQGEIFLDPNGTSAVYYRLDYGMYQTVNTSLYSSESMSLHFNVYSTQIGAGDDTALGGQIWQVSNEEQLREILISATNGDTIQLIDDVEVAGTLNIPKRIHLDTNDYDLTITGDLVYDFANMGELLIDVTGEGTINIGNDLYINTPKAEVDILGGNKTYDIVVGGNTTFNGIQDGEKDGIYLESLNIVNSTTTLVPADAIIRSNTRLTISSNVTLGTIYAEEGSTNIEVINNGNIVQLNFSEMNLIKSFTKAQIYVYNLGNIYGIIGSTSIVLPEESTPYLGPNNGNTWIVKGITSNDITISGSENFDSSDIEDNMSDVYVIPIEGEDNSYIVYIKDSVSTVEGLLVDYFTQEDYEKPYEQIYEIRKLVIYTLNAQYFENEDFDFLKSDLVPYLKHLDLSNSRIIDDTTANRIKNGAMQDKTSLKELVLSSTVTEIGDYAFSGVSLGSIPNNDTEGFYFATIPSSVKNIGDHAFDQSEFIYFESNNPPTFSENTFNNELSKFFVNGGAINTYLNLNTIDESKLYQKGILSDDRRYIVFEYNDGLGISYVINNVISTSTIGIPTNITFNGTNKKVYIIGINSYRHMDIYLETGSAVSLPTTVIRIDYSAFRNLNITSIVLSSVIEVGDYAFANTNIDMLQSSSIEIIGNHAFEKTKIKELSLSSIDTIGDYAFSNVETMYSAYLYNISDIGDYAFENCKYLNKVYFTNKETSLVNNGEEIAITVGTDAVFNNWGFYTDGRLRVYVPDGISGNGNTYLSLYQSKFTGNENYIFVTGHEIGSYTHLAVPYDINVYTVREVDLYGINGWEIVSYQGADLNSDYVIPETLTYNNVTKNVISIGDYAYRNVLFEEDATISIKNATLIKLGNYALSNMDITNIKANSLIEIGPYALYGTMLQTAEFPSLETLGDYALAELLTLNMINLGTVKNIGYAALYNDANLEQIFINNTTYDIVLGQNAFYNVGVNATTRFRMYVPEGETSLNYYKTLFVNYADYIYETGIIIGSYINAPIMYDIGEYSVKLVELTDRNGNSITGYELIEYHGANLSNAFRLPDTVLETSLDVSISKKLTTSWQSGEYYWQYDVTLTNNTNTAISDWKIKINTTNMTIRGLWNVTQETHDNYIVASASNSSDVIPANGSKTFGIQYSSPDSNYNLSMQYFTNSLEEIPLISIGNNAFIHTSSNENINITINNSNLINIGNNAFYNIQGITKIELPQLTTLGDYAFYNNSLNMVELPNLKSIGTYALANNTNLYYINLGKVIEMKNRSLYNLNNLLQVFFTPTDETIIFDPNAIDNVGTLTNNRIRFYVDKLAYNIEDESYENINLNVNYNVDSQTTTGNGVNQRHKYTITATVTNPSNKDVSSWSAIMELGSNGVFSGVTNGANAINNAQDNTVKFSSTGTNGTINANGKTTFTFIVNTSDRYTWEPSFTEATGIHISLDLFTTNIEVVNTYKNSFKEEYRDYFYNKGKIIGQYTPSNIPFEIGEYSVDYKIYEDLNGDTHYGYEIVEYHGGDINNAFVIPEEITIDDIVMPLISIGKYAFRWANMNGDNTFDITSNNLLLIDDYALYNMGVHVLNAPNVDRVGDYALYNNQLYTVELTNLQSIGAYALYNNKILNYVNLGNVSTIGEYAMGNCTAIEQIFFNNTNADASTITMNIAIGENAFNNIATEIGKRFRIYVPDGDVTGSATYKEAYINTLPSGLSDYIFETGILINDYTYSVLPYNIHEFSVKEVTINNISGYKIIEYHGPDINENFEIPNEITINNVSKPVISIGKGAYVGVEIATNETWNLVIPNNIITIEDRAFYKTGISSISSTAILESIGVEAFAELPNLTNVNLGTVKYIYEKAFNLNKELTTVRLGTDVQYIGPQAFYNTYNDSKLTRVYLATETPPQIETNTWPAGQRFIIWTTYKTYFYVPRQSVEDYQNATNWSTRENYINASSELYDNTYYYELDETTNEITIVEYIGNSNNTLTIPNTFTIENVTYNVTGIKAEAFDASNVRTITLPRYMSYIEEGFLNNNDTVININVNANNTLFSSIDGVLYDYNGQTLIRYPRARTNNSYTITTGTKVLANSSFANSTSLTTLNFNLDLIAIGTGVFTGAGSLRTLNFTSSTPPYLMGFGSFPTNYNMTMNYPTGSDDAYNNNLFYYSYRNYLRAN